MLCCTAYATYFTFQLHIMFELQSTCTKSSAACSIALSCTMVAASPSAKMLSLPRTASHLSVCSACTLPCIAQQHTGDAAAAFLPGNHA